jgi:triosephosphate isomerase
MLDQRELGKTEEVLQIQLSRCLSHLTAKEVEKLTIAYEPVWAIGTGRNATPDMAQRAHRFCRDVLAEKWGHETAEKVVMQYGGSVKSENAKELLEQPDIDGLLIGGASLDVDTFNKIIHAQHANTARNLNL